MNTDLIKAEAGGQMPYRDTSRRELEVLDESLVQALAPSASGPGRLAAQGLARALRRCLSTDGRLLDFRQLRTGRRDLPGALPVGAWLALQACAKSLNREGIVQVIFPPEAASMALPPVIEGLNVLPALDRVHLPAPAEGGQVDLSRLRARGPAPAVMLSGRTAGLKVKAPNGLHVEAVADDVAATRAVVSYVDAQDLQVGSPRTVPGVIYRRSPSEDSVPPSAVLMRETDQQAAPSGSDVSCSVPDAPVSAGPSTAEEGTGSPSSLAQRQEPAPAPVSSQSTRPGVNRGDAAARTASRQLALRWLHDRWSYQRQKAEARARQAAEGAAALATTVPQGSALPPRAYEQLRLRGAHALFDASQFGNMIRQELQAMRPGDFRHFALCTERHLMGLEVHIKVGRHGHESRDEYIVNLFDPADPSGPKRVVTDSPDWFRGRGLEAWGDLAAHFASGRRIGTLFRWPPADSAESVRGPAGVQLHIAGSHFTSLEFLRHALEEGAVRGVAAFARQVFASAESARTVCQRLLSGEVSSGLVRAMQLGRADAVAQWADAVLRAAPDVLSVDQRFGLLVAEVSGRAAARQGPPLAMAFMQGQYRAVAAFTEAVARARRDVLTPARHLELLLAPDTAGRPVLHALSDADNWRRTRQSPDPELPTRQQKAAYRYVLAIASSELPQPVKRQVCVSSYRRPGIAGLLRTSSAARAAIDAGHAGVAGAMASAILDAGTTPQATADLLRHLGVRMDHLLDALVGPGTRHLYWAVRIVESLDQSGLKRREIDSLNARYGWIRREARSLEARLSAVALPSGRDALTPTQAIVEPHEP
jgi:hypothetical protein